jgi:hypothetical protein
MIQFVKVSAYMPMEAGEAFYVRGLNGQIEEVWHVENVKRFESGAGVARINIQGYKDTSKL